MIIVLRSEKFAHRFWTRAARDETSVRDALGSLQHEVQWSERSRAPRGRIRRRGNVLRRCRGWRVQQSRTEQNSSSTARNIRIQHDRRNETKYQFTKSSSVRHQHVLHVPRIVDHATVFGDNYVDHISGSAKDWSAAVVQLRARAWHVLRSGIKRGSVGNVPWPATTEWSCRVQFE